jgi:NAD(P)-dependent dehydrogenase (short-subunit alcohol dehydrogenase family)
MLLQGKRIIVTGGSRGLGRAFCLEFARQGASVAFSFHRNEVEADATLTALRGLGTRAIAFKAPVLDTVATEAMLREVEASWGAIDVLVNNAGISQNLPLALLEEADWDHVMDTNVKGTYLTSRAALRSMIRRKAGLILNIGSLAGERMIEAPIHYCASKAAVRGLTQALAKEVARYNIRVLCLAPGLLEDGLGRNLPEHRLEAYLYHCSLGRVGTFDEVARFAAFLVSDQNSYMSGETILMDGGV